MVVTAETAGRLLVIATPYSSVVEVIEDIRTPQGGFAVEERTVESVEVGKAPRKCRTSCSVWCAMASCSASRHRRPVWCSPATSFSTYVWFRTEAPRFHSQC